MAHGDNGFRWIAWNIDKVQRHGLSIDDAENAVLSPLPRYPMHHGAASWIAKSQLPRGTYVQVVYLIDPDGTIFVIHGMPMLGKKRRRRRRRGR